MIRALLGNAGSALLATLLAIMVWYVAVNETNPLQEGSYPAGGIAIEAINAPPGLEIVGGLRDRAQLRLVAPRSVWDNPPSGDLRAYVDLHNLDPGIHTVSVEVVCPWCEENRARLLNVTPKQIAVRLEERATREMDVQVNLVGDALVGFSLQTPSVAPAKVTLKGPRSAVESVAQVQATVIVNNPRADVERTVSVFPLAKDGATVAGVTLEPPRVTVSVPVEQEQGYRELAVSVVRDINPAGGYWISNITVDPSTVTVNGPPNIIKNLPSALQTEAVRAQDVTQSFEQRVPLLLPDGVTLVGLREPLITVRVDVQAETSGRTFERSVQARNTPPGLVAATSPAQVQVIVFGPIPKLREINPETDVKVYVDLSGLPAGSHTVVPRLDGIPTGLETRFIPDRLDVTLTPIIPPTPPSP